MTYFYMKAPNQILQINLFDSREHAKYKLAEFKRRFEGCYIEIEQDGKVIEIIR